MVPIIISLFLLYFPAIYPQKTDEIHVTKIFTAKTIPNKDIGIPKSLAIEEKSGGNKPKIILSKAAKATKTNIV